MNESMNLFAPCLPICRPWSIPRKNGGASGTAYAFASSEKKAKLVPGGKLLPSDGAASDFFGYSVALDQTDNSGVVIIGADLKGVS